MDEKILVDGHVILSPDELHLDIYSLLEQKIKDKYIVCNREYGYIKSLCKIHNKFRSDVERNTGNVKIHVRFLAERILPIIGKQLICTVHMIFNHGIFAQIGENIKILIPLASITDGKFFTNGDPTNEGSDQPLFKIESRDPSKSKIILRDDIITITITEVKYNKNRYNCIGLLC